MLDMHPCLASSALFGPLDAYVEFFAAWELFRDAAIAGALGGATIGLLGVYILIRRMVFFSAALSQIAGLGVALALLIQSKCDAHAHSSSPIGVAALLTAATALWLARDQSAGGRRRDAALGITYLTGASGILVIGSKIPHELHDIDALLFGSAVAVLPAEFNLLATSAAVIFLIHVAGHRGFIGASIDAEGARIRGLPVALLHAVLLFTLALGVSVGTRVLGALPVFAFSILPAIAALAVASHLTQALWLATAIGAASGFCGYVAAYVHDLPVGAAQAGLALIVVAVAKLANAAVAGARVMWHRSGMMTNK